MIELDTKHLTYKIPTEQRTALELLTFELKRADYNIFKILSNIKTIKKTLIQDVNIFWLFTQSIDSYVNHSKILSACLFSPETYPIKCNDIRIALQGTPPKYFRIPPSFDQSPSAVDNHFFQIISQAIDEYISILSSVEFLEAGWLSELEVIHRLIHLGELIAYCHPIDPYALPPDFKPYEGQQKGADAIRQKKRERDRKVLELWDSKPWKSYAHFAKCKSEECGYTVETLRRELPRILKRRETL